MFKVIDSYVHVPWIYLLTQLIYPSLFIFQVFLIHISIEKEGKLVDVFY